MKKYIVGVDIGGTKIATGLINRDGKLGKKIVVPTHSGPKLEQSLNQVYQSIEDLLKISKISKKNIEGIGVCAPGPLNPVKGIVHNPPTS
ncbi:ROK family protein [Candidatus Omnitrophota bacterium]